MWKVVSARLRGSESELSQMGEDTDGLVTSTSKLQAKVKALTGGFDIMKDKDTYKDIYDIIVGIGERWSDLNDISRADLLETLAGKQRSNALAAALNNVEIIKEAYNTAANDSDGSAERELSNYKQGIEYHIERFKSAFQELSTDTISSNLFKGIVDGGTVALEVLDKLTSAAGGFGIALTTITGYNLFKNLDLFYY